MNRGSLCVIVCGAGPAPRVGVLVDLAQADGWAVRIFATPAAMGFLDDAALARQTGFAVRSDYGAPGKPRAHSSAADAVIIAPATYNTINKLALGINDTYALNVAAEAIGRGVRTVVLPFVNNALAARQPFQRAVEALRQEGVTVLYGPGQWMPHQPGTGSDHIETFPWKSALMAAAQA